MTYTPPASPQPYLPNVDWSIVTPVPTRADIESVAVSPTDSQLQVAAENAPIREVYGRTRIGAQIADILIYGGNLIVLAVWCGGEIDAVESVTVNDAPLPTGITATHYIGTAGQTVDPLLVSAYAAAGVTFTSAFPGIAYSVFRVKPAENEGFPEFAAIIRGKKVYDPRTGLTVYSDNPALCTADFMYSSVYGLNRNVDFANWVAGAADYCDTLVGGEKRRLIGLAIDDVQPTRQWLEALRVYASCFIQSGVLGLRLVPDKAGTSVASFDNSTIVAGSMRINKRGVMQLPTVVDIVYTDTTVMPWSEKHAYAKAAGVDAGTTPRRESQIHLPGIHRYSQALREAIERLNKLTLSDLTATFTVFDAGLAIEEGDIITATHALGLSGKYLRISSAAPIAPGRWALSGFEYDDAAYSDVIEAEPTYNDTDLPNPAAPPDVTGLSVKEEVYQLENGIFSSRLFASWDAVDYIYIQSFVVEVYSSGQLITTANVTKPEYRSGPVQDSIPYQVRVAAVTTLPATGEWAQAHITPVGKSLIPGDVPSVMVFEAGGRIHGQCEPAVDIDIWRYEWRYWPQTGGYTWDTSTLIDRVDALRIQSDTVPVGDWVIGVKALDSVGQYSAHPATANVSVTSDARAFFVDSYDSDTPALTNMASYTLAPTDSNVYYVTEDGVAFETKFSSGLDTYTDPIATYHNSVTSTWLGEPEDFGQLLGGQWTGTATVEAINGSYISYIGLSDDNSLDPYDYASGLSRKANGRFARLKHEAATTATLLVTVPTQNIRLDAIPREEVGSGTSSASAATTVTLANVYVATKKLTLTPEGTTARIAVFDNIVLGDPTTFDVYIFDAAGAQVACDFLYQFQGV